MTIQEINDEIRYDRIHRFDDISAELGHFVGYIIKLMINTPMVAFIMYYCQEKYYELERADSCRHEIYP